jgi:hypothetical protein
VEGCKQTNQTAVGGENYYQVQKWNQIFICFSPPSLLYVPASRYFESRHWNSLSNLKKNPLKFEITQKRLNVLKKIGWRRRHGNGLVGDLAGLARGGTEEARHSKNLGRGFRGLDLAEQHRTYVLERSEKDVKQRIHFRTLQAHIAICRFCQLALNLPIQ